jgi:hypothetical protein
VELQNHSGYDEAKKFTVLLPGIELWPQRCNQSWVAVLGPMLYAH